MNLAVEAFAAEARIYCTWATNVEEGDEGAAAALRRIVALYQAALRLPQPSIEATHDNHYPLVTRDERAGVLAACARLPLQYYSELSDPLSVPSTEEAVAGDVADDIADIFGDVLAGLRCFERGQVPDALWEWSYNFQIHWGGHAVSAIRALHAYLVRRA